MKFIYFIFIVPLLALSTISLTAQPTLTLEGQTPAVGSSYNVLLFDVTGGFDPGASGANQTWDYAQMNPALAVKVDFSILAPADAPGNQDFPDADFVWLLNGFGTYNYYKVETSSLNLIGGVAVTAGNIFFTQIFTKADERLQFPATYQDKYSYTSTFKSILFNLETQVTRTGEVEYDAYGTIKTPYGTYENVLRMKIETSSSDLAGITETQYAWILPGEFIPLAVYTISTDAEETPSVYFAEPNMVSTTTQNQRYDYGVRLIANPVKDQLQLKGLEGLSKDAQLSIVGLNGSRQEIQVTDNATILLGSGPKGMYFLSIQDAKGLQVIPFTRF